MTGHSSHNTPPNPSPPFAVQDSLPELLERAESKYRTRFEPVTIGGHVLELLQLADMEAHIDTLAEAAGEEGIELPFWAKIWPTSVLLSTFLLKLPPDPTRQVLEIGAGIGLCGLIAAKHGFQVLITDNHPDALLFARINVLQNGLHDRAGVASLDFTTGTLERRFPIILGSEVVYRQEDYAPLVRFLERHLEEGSEAHALLAQGYIRRRGAFSDLVRERFSIQEKTMGYRERGAAGSASQERHLCTIAKLTPRPHEGS